jgi:adenosylcobinamide-GDP ribazoletransferase
VKTFLQALSFLTILPVGHPSLSEEKELAGSMVFFPLVGLIIGLILTLGYYLFSFLFSRSLVLWLLIGLLAFLTRGLHLDGLADTVDGLASGGTKEKILEVMRDSRIGAFGVISLILLFGAKFFCLDQIPDSSLPCSFIVMSVLGRNAMVLVCYRSFYARREGLAKPFVEHLRIHEVAVSFLSALGIALLLMRLQGIVAFVGVALFSLGCRFFFKRRLGGITGDVLGATNEFSEVLCLVILIVFESLSPAA